MGTSEKSIPPKYALTLEVNVACQYNWKAIFNSGTPSNYMPTYREFFSWSSFRLEVKEILIRHFASNSDFADKGPCYVLKRVKANQKDTLELQEFLTTVVQKKKDCSRQTVEPAPWVWKENNNLPPKNLCQKYFVGPGIAFGCRAFMDSLYPITEPVAIQVHLKALKMISGIKVVSGTDAHFDEPPVYIHPIHSSSSSWIYNGAAMTTSGKFQTMYYWLVPEFTYCRDKALTGVRIVTVREVGSTQDRMAASYQHFPDHPARYIIEERKREQPSKIIGCTFETKTVTPDYYSNDEQDDSYEYSLVCETKNTDVVC